MFYYSRGCCFITLIFIGSTFGQLQNNDSQRKNEVTTGIRRAAVTQQSLNTKSNTNSVNSNQNLSPSFIAKPESDNQQRATPPSQPIETSAQNKAGPQVSRFQTNPRLSSFFQAKAQPSQPLSVTKELNSENSQSPHVNQEVSNTKVSPLVNIEEVNKSFSSASQPLRQYNINLQTPKSNQEQNHSPAQQPPVELKNTEVVNNLNSEKEVIENSPKNVAQSPSANRRFRLTNIQAINPIPEFSFQPIEQVNSRSQTPVFNQKIDGQLPLQVQQPISEQQYITPQELLNVNSVSKPVEHTPNSLQVKSPEFSFQPLEQFNNRLQTPVFNQKIDGQLPLHVQQPISEQQYQRPQELFYVNSVSKPVENPPITLQVKSPEFSFLPLEQFNNRLQTPVFNERTEGQIPLQIQQHIPEQQYSRQQELVNVNTASKPVENTPITLEVNLPPPSPPTTCSSTPNFIPPQMPPLVIKSSSNSGLKSLLPILLLALTRNGGYGGYNSNSCGCCSCGNGNSPQLPIPYQVPAVYSQKSKKTSSKRKTKKH